MQCFLETEQLVRVRVIRANKAILPQKRGIYGLFFHVAPPEVPIDNCFVREGASLLYIGTAGANLKLNGTLRKRIGNNHLGGNERRSTICQTLATLLPEIAGPPIPKDEKGKIKLHTSPDGAKRLREWMDQNISVCWTQHPDPSCLGSDLIRSYGPPLNIDYSEHPFSVVLSGLREERRNL